MFSQLRAFSPWAGLLALGLAASHADLGWAQIIAVEDATDQVAQASNTEREDANLDLDDARAKRDELIQEVIEPELTLEVNPQRSKLIRTKRPVSRFSITNPDIAEIVQFGPTEFELIGAAEGETTLTLWFGEPMVNATVLRYLIKVSRDTQVEDRLKLEYGELQDMVNEMFPNSSVQLIPLADKLIVRGQARDSKEATEIMTMIRGETTNQSGDLLGPGSYGNYGPFIAQGSAAVVHPGSEDAPSSQVISLLHVPGEHQVLLKVRVAEITRSALRELGVDFSVAKDNFFISSILGGGGNVNALLDGGDVNLFIKAFASNGNSKILAEPNLVAMSGQTASFIAGGQFAVPTVVGIGGAAASTTSFQGFGTQVSFTPTVIDKDRIRLQVAPTFSTVNNDNAVNGIPGLNTRSVFTTVDMREGQWLALAGLLQDQQVGSKGRIPLLGDIPVLETFFSTKQIKRDETELIILVSPELIHPMEAEQVPLVLPGMEVTEPGPFEFYLGGKIEGDPNCDHRSTVWPTHRENIRHAVKEAKRQTRYQRSEKYYVCGPHGFTK